MSVITKRTSLKQWVAPTALFPASYQPSFLYLVGRSSTFLLLLYLIIKTQGLFHVNTFLIMFI